MTIDVDRRHRRDPRNCWRHPTSANERLSLDRG
jgi:hypothetical protein